ncbi:hypothetical protein PRK78_005434 [Emydomyces testavorans]|uniref:Uncharacterized protein n=1 Tax=Emydomyces testavorans TaxID=2070801 RepID=A0AAF0IKM1_9EURO|nr:hypothetical protein PRK78_005434 [Emydomyces testavorans]
MLNYSIYPLHPEESCSILIVNIRKRQTKLNELASSVPERHILAMAPEQRRMLMTLPAEVLLEIVDSLHSEADINALARTSHQFYSLVNPYLYGHNVKYCRASAMFWGIEQAESNTLLMALEAGANVHQSKGYFGGALGHLIDMLACSIYPLYGVKKGNELLQILLDNGADMNFRSGNEDTPLQAAMLYRAHETFIRIMIENGADIEAVSIGHRWHLVAGYFFQNESFVTYLIERGINMNVEDEDGWTLLHVASLKRCYNVCELLIENGADIHSRTSDGETPLLAAVSGLVDEARGSKVWSKLEKTLLVLLNNGADVNMCSYTGVTPLRYAVDSGHPKMIELLISRGAKVNFRDIDGRTQLHRVRKTQAAFMLIRCGAIPDIKDNYGTTALRGNISRPPEDAMIYAGDIYAVSSDGKTFLHSAAATNNARLLLQLIAYDADIHAQDNEGNTALHLAIFEGNVDAACMLIVLGASLDITNNQGLGMRDLLKLSEKTCLKRDMDKTMGGDSLAWTRPT